MNKLRFHLQRGENYMKWQYKTSDKKTTKYFPTKDFYGVIRGKLHNNRKVADAIHSGSNKNVCAWIASINGLSAANSWELMCSEVNFMNGDYLQVQYNPRNKPYWTVGGMDIDVDNYNGLFFIFEKKIYTDIEAINFWLQKNKGISLL